MVAFWSSTVVGRAQDVHIRRYVCNHVYKQACPHEPVPICRRVHKSWSDPVALGPKTKTYIWSPKVYQWDLLWATWSQGNYVPVDVVSYHTLFSVPNCGVIDS